MPGSGCSTVGEGRVDGVRGCRGTVPCTVTGLCGLGTKIDDGIPLKVTRVGGRGEVIVSAGAVK